MGNEKLKIKMNSGQTDNPFLIEDSTGTDLAWITPGGKIHTDSGVRAECNDMGDGLSAWAHGEFTPEHTITDNAGNYDYTGGAYEQLFTDTTNSPFTQTDADNHNWLNINSGTYKGAKAQIDRYIDASNVTVHSNCWDTDMSSVDYKIYPAPTFIVNDCHSIHAYANANGHFHIQNSGGDFTGTVLSEIDGKIGADNSDTFHIYHNANGFNNSDAQHIFYETGDMQDGDEGQVLQISIDETGATGGKVHGLYLETTDASAAEKEAIRVSVGFDYALKVAGATAEDPNAGYEVLADHTVADRVNGGAGDGNAFLEAGNDLQILDNDNDYILLGRTDHTFEVIEAILATPSSKDMEFEFYYSQADGVWVEFFPDDSTAGFTKSGLIDWDTSGWTGGTAWAKTNDTAAAGDNDLLEAYYIKIVRTYPNVVPVLPVEDYFKLYPEQAGDTSSWIRGDGVQKHPYLTGAPSDLVNGMEWMEADGKHIYYNGAEKLVAGV